MVLWLLTSLMLTPSEEKQVESFVDEDTEIEATQNPKGNNNLLSVSSIFYINAKNWYVWINGQKFKPDQQEGEKFSLVGVEPDRVMIRLHKHPKRVFTLGQMEKIDITSGKTIDYYE